MMREKSIGVREAGEVPVSGDGQFGLCPNLREGR
jgi:hypothetical protein